MKFTTAALSLFAALAMIEPSHAGGVGKMIKGFFTGKRDTQLWTREGSIQQSFSACMAQAKESLYATSLGGSKFKLAAADKTIPEPCVVIADSYIHRPGGMTDGTLVDNKDGSYTLDVLPKDQKDWQDLADASKKAMEGAKPQ